MLLSSQVRIKLRKKFQPGCFNFEAKLLHELPMSPQEEIDRLRAQILSTGAERSKGRLFRKRRPFIRKFDLRLLNHEHVIGHGLI